MFGAILPSRPVQTNLQTLSPTQFAFTLPPSPIFHHIVVFLLPGTVLPADTAAAVYLQLPNTPDFKLLGAIGNEKQSAIFRINSLLAVGKNENAEAGGEGDDFMTDETFSTDGDQTTMRMGDIVLGISVEPAATISAQLSTIKRGADVARPGQGALATSTEMVRRPPSTKVLASRIIKNAFNFLASFAGGRGGNEMVPLKSFQNWWIKFEKRIDLDPGFLERDEEDL
ncbi:MAG: hypothetical protein M1827_002374 [Pycnora praestabilis]|nr:MAG: hypothetical protein M1827_002374 [Pycnora praestabilis]